MQKIQERLGELSQTLDVVAKAEEECNAANVEENDYTVLTHQDLVFEVELVVQSIAKKMAFIDNQVITSHFSSLCLLKLFRSFPGT